MYNIAKKYLLLGLSLSLLIVVAVFFFNQKETTAPQIEIATKKQTKLTHIKYEGAVVVAEELDNIDDIIVELDAIQTAGTFSLTAMAQSITAEALKAFSDTDEYSLPLLSHWNVGIPELTDAMNPMYMIGRIEQGEHILVSWKLDPYYADTIGSSYYEESIKKAAELQLPLVFILPAPESALTKDSYYKNLSIEDNPNVIDENNNTLDKLSPFGPDERWNEVGNQWSSTTLMNQLQEWYPNPPLVVFISEDEAAKLSWNEVSIASRYWECYSECSPEMQDDNYKRILLGGKWIEKYRQMQNGFKEGFTESAWKDNVKFISYNNFSDDFGKSADWIDNATVTNQYVNLWPLTADGATINFDLTGTKSDATADSPHILANNLPFMLKEAKSENQNPNFAYQLSIDDDSKIIDPTQYRGLTQFALWFLRPNFIRQKSSGTIRTELEPMFKEVVDSVELIHYNPQVAEFWKNGKLVQNGDSYLNENIPEQYQNDPRWFLLDADVNPPKPWSDDTSIKVWAFALVKGEAPNREWLIYAQSPENEISNVAVEIPDYGDILVDSKVNGSFYVLPENNAVSKINIISEVIPSNENNNTILGALPVDPGIPTITGTSYYVDASTTGTEVGTLDNPFKTLAQAELQVLNPGDALLFKRGEIWEGQFGIKWSGDNLNRVVYGAYGIGDHPIITTLVEQTLTWNSIGNNIWQSTEDVVDITRLHRNNIEIMKAYGDEVLGDTVPSLCEWNIVNSKLQVYNDPTGDTFKFASIEDTMKADSIHYVTLYGLDIRGGRESGIAVLALENFTFSYMKLSRDCYNGVRFKNTSTNANNVIFDSCIVDSGWTLNYKEAGIGAASARGAREGIYVSGTHSNFTYTNNYFKNHTHSALNIWADGGIITNTVIKNNYFTSPDIPYGGRIALMGDHQRYEIAYNIFENQFGARAQVEGTGGHIHHNIWKNIKDSLIDSPGGEGSCIRMGDWYTHTHDNIIENNIFYECQGAIDVGATHTFVNGQGLELLTIQNNIFYEVSTEAIYNSIPIFIRNGNYTDYNKDLTIKNNISYSSVNDFIGNFVGSFDETHRVAITQFEVDATSKESIASSNISGDPLFIDADNGDFRLKSDSPAMDTGIKPFSTEDYYGNTISSTSNNIGIWE